MSQALATTLARASEGARAARAAEVTLEHVLAALCDDPDAADVLIQIREAARHQVAQQQRSQWVLPWWHSELTLAVLSASLRVSVDLLV